MLKAILAAGVVTVALSGAASAAVVLQDDFNYGAVDVLNVGQAPYANFLMPNWTATPTIDYIITNTYGNLCRGTGGCIDLDGSTLNPGILESSATFSVGRYELSLSMFGNSRGAANDTVTIRLGNSAPLVLTFASADALNQTFTFVTTVAGKLSFLNSDGNDNQGAVLTSVTLSAVPLPAAGLLLLAGLGGLVAMGRRRAAALAA